MKPLDPRLIREAPQVRRYLATSGVAAVLTAGLIIVQMSLMADLLAGAILHRVTLAGVWPELCWLAAAFAGRAAVAWLLEESAQRCAGAVKARLRGRILARLLDRGPRWLAGRSTGELVTLVTRGLDALDAYFARYLPQLVLSVVVPAAVIVRLLVADWLTALIVVMTLPLIPVFMVLIGMAAKRHTERQWSLLAKLSAHFLDVVEGLPTLRLFGRAKAQVEAVRRVTEQHRRATMSTLRIAFLSALVLELLATLSTALVAVSAGLRLVDGQLTYQTALLVLLLTPEAYLPLRQVGMQFHASMEGVTAADAALSLLEDSEAAAAEESPIPDVNGIHLPQLATATISFRSVSISCGDRTEPALDGFNLDIAAGERVGLVGPSGAGKSTVLDVLLGFARPTSGCVLVGGVPLNELVLEDWRSQLAWVPQRPHLFTASIADNIRLGRPRATDEEVAAAARAAGAEEFIAALPRGYNTVLGERGQDLSAGQRQRIAVARAFLRDAPLLLLDEPTANLDPESESVVTAAIDRLMAGRTVLLVSHRDSTVAAVDRVVTLRAGRAVAVSA